MTDFDPYSGEQIRFLRQDPTGRVNPVSWYTEEEYRLSEYDGFKAFEGIIIAVVGTLAFWFGVWLALIT